MAFSMDYGTGFEMGNINLVPDADRSSGNEKPGITGFAHTGDYGLINHAGGSPGWIRFSVSGSPSEIYVGAWFNPHGSAIGADGQMRLEVLDSSLNVLAAVRFNSGQWDAYRGSTKVDDGAVDLNDEWHHVQAHFSIADSGGAIETKIDGIDDISFSGDTQPGSTASIAYVRCYAASEDHYVDDLCFGTGGWPGDIRFEALVPNADTATINWTGSDADQTDNYALVDETGPSTSDYVESTTNGDQDKYDLENFTLGNKDPIAVILWAYAQKDEADSHQLKLILDDGTEDIGSAQDLLTSYTYLYRIDTVPPSGGSWTDALLDALEVGVESVIV